MALAQAGMASWSMVTKSYRAWTFTAIEAMGAAAASIYAPARTALELDARNYSAGALGPGVAHSSMRQWIRAAQGARRSGAPRSIRTMPTRSMRFTCWLCTARQIARSPAARRQCASTLRPRQSCADSVPPAIIHEPSYSMLNRWIERDGLLAALEKHDRGCIAFTPLAQGLLTNKYLNGVPPGSRATAGKTLLPEFLNEETLSRIRALNAIAQRRGQSLAQMAIAWVLRDPRMTSALHGSKSPGADRRCRSVHYLDWISTKRNYRRSIATPSIATSTFGPNSSAS